MLKRSELDDVLMFFLEDTIKTIEQIVGSSQPESSAIICKRRLELYINLKKEKDLEYQSLTYEDIIDRCGYDEAFISDYKNKIELEKVYFQG